MGGCTDFCSSLKAIHVNQGTLLSHEALLEQLRFSIDDKEQGKLLGTLQELLSRPSCAFCRFVVAAISDSLKPERIDSQDLTTPVRVLIFPGEQSLRLSFPSSLGLRLVFFTDDVQQVVGPDTARSINPQGVQVEDIKKWLTTCDANHTDCALESVKGVEERFKKSEKMRYLNGFNEKITSNFRVLDLELGYVKRATLDVKYVTLSYVWGNLPMFRLRIDNLEHLSTPGSLEDIRSELPQTVNDAIDVVKALGERYIWIDVLCLVQDDAGDVNLGIEMMNSIYHGSYFTIVAGTGTDADAGLPGFGGRPRNPDSPQMIADISPGLRMSYAHGVDWHLNKSYYNKRGWTLQELILPRRTLVFINGQVFFRCRRANWSEDLWSDNYQEWLDPDDSNIIRLPDPAAGFMPSFWAYQKICEDYSRRRLRNDGDALRAIAGITRTLAAGMETMLIDGIPGYYLDHLMLFTSSTGRARRRSEFASFSWAGWEGSIMFPRENYIWFDKDGHRTWDTANVLRYFRARSLIQWESLDTGANTESLTSFYSYNTPSRLFKLMKKYPHVFPDLKQNPEQSLQHLRWNSGSGSHGDSPRWFPWDTNENEIDDDETGEEIQRKLQPHAQFSPKGMDLANGHEEFLRLVGRITDPRAKLTMMNWLAVRKIRERMARDKTTAVGPRSVYRSPERGNYHFREADNAERRAKRRRKLIEDRRVDTGRRHRENAARKDGKAFDPDNFEIPLFPPYLTLAFVTLSMHLNIGKPLSDQLPPGGEPFARIPGVPLQATSGKIVGSLHPDNLGLLAEPGSAVELLIISYCNTPMTGSALLSNDDKDAENLERRWELLWVLYIVWIDGIAERRGVGQILEFALGDAVRGRPQAKYVLLG